MRTVRHIVIALCLAAPTIATAQDVPVEEPATGETAVEGTPPVAEDPVAEPVTPVEEPVVAPPAVEKKGALVGVKYDKGFTFATDDDQFELKIQGRAQPRWEVFKSRADDSELEHRFSIARLRLTLEGRVFEKVGFKFQTEFGKGFVYVRDMYTDAPIGPVRLRVGQFKKPFSRQHITSSSSLAFADRSITDGFSGAGRDLGVMIHNDYDKSPEGLEWAFGIVNGTGEKPATTTTCTTNAMMVTTCATGLPSNVPKDIGPQLALRAGWNSPKLKGYSEGDLEGGPLRFGVAASYLLDLKDGKSELFEHRVGLDFVVKVNGLAATGGGYLVDKTDTDGDFDFGKQLGVFAQVGFMVKPKEMEVSARFSRLPAGDENLIEGLAGFSWYMHGHPLKLQLNAGVLHQTGDDAAGGGTDIVGIAQSQIVF